MPKFTFTCEHDSNHKSTMEYEAEFLQDVVSEFELFLRGCGYYFDGNLEFVTEEKEEVFDFGHKMDNSEAAEVGWPFPKTRPGSGELVPGPVDESGIGNNNG